MRRYAVSQHAVERYQLRVERTTRAIAAATIEDSLRDARSRPTPRHWMRTRAHGSGTTFAYSPRAPHIGFVVVKKCVVTVVTRELCRRSHPPCPSRRPARDHERQYRSGSGPMRRRRRRSR
jgi:hypothetical protein